MNDAIFKTVASCILLLLQISNAAEDSTAPSTSKPAVKCVMAEKKTSPRTDTLIITGRIAEIPGRFVENDAYDYVYIMKYRVIAVEKGMYNEKEILVGHYNPLIARKLIKDKMDSVVDGSVEKFIIGEKHRLTLIAPIDALWKDAIEDEYYDTELEKYFAVKADLIK
jgi:hypothetical protein